MLSKSMSEYATENVPPQYVQWMGNNSSVWGTTLQLQTATCNFLVVDKMPSPPKPEGMDGGGTGGGGAVDPGSLATPPTA